MNVIVDGIRCESNALMRFAGGQPRLSLIMEDTGEDLCDHVSEDDVKRLEKCVQSLFVTQGIDSYQSGPWVVERG